MDVKSTFLNGIFHEEVYVDQTLGFVIEGKEDKICKLKKALYCLKQARRAWYEETDSYFSQKLGFTEVLVKPHCIPRQLRQVFSLSLCMWLDDIIYTGCSNELISEFKSEMMKQYEMTD